MVVTVESLVSRLEYDPKRREAGKTNIERIIRGEEVDRLPICPGLPQSGSSQWTFEEQFHDGDKMLISHLEGMVFAANACPESIPCIRPNLGVVFVPSLFGLNWVFTEDCWPWPEGHLSREELGPMLDDPSIVTGQIRKSGLMPKALSLITRFKEAIGPRGHVYVPDNQGPFDLAHMIYGDRLFTDVYDDPGFVRALMNLVTEVYIHATRMLKEAVGEPLDQCVHGHGMTAGISMSNGGIRLSEDTTTLLSPKIIEEFVLPYISKALKAFGGGFIHYCGKNEGFFKLLMDLDEVRMINLGNPEKHDMGQIVRTLISKGKAYFGVIPLMPGEDIRAYFNRALDLTGRTRKGLVFVPDPAVWELGVPRDICSIWQDMQS